MDVTIQHNETTFTETGVDSIEVEDKKAKISKDNEMLVDETHVFDSLVIE